MINIRIISFWNKFDRAKITICRTYQLQHLPGKDLLFDDRSMNRLKDINFHLKPPLSSLGLESSGMKYLILLSDAQDKYIYSANIFIIYMPCILPLWQKIINDGRNPPGKLQMFVQRHWNVVLTLLPWWQIYVNKHKQGIIIPILIVFIQVWVS